jgi:hypothetical protein
MNFSRSFALALATTAYFQSAPSKAPAQSAATADPITAAQTEAARRSAVQSVNETPALAIEAAAVEDPIRAAQVMQAAERTFPNLAEDLKVSDLLRKAAADPGMRGNLRGRLTEEDFLRRSAKQGWKGVKKRNAPQNDVWRRVNGKLEGGQIKVHADWKEYLRSMRKDNKAEHFFIPDDHYELVRADLETRRLGALRGGLVEKAEEYAQQQKRLAKVGRTFSEIDGSIECALKNSPRISAALRSAGKATPFIGIALGLLDGSISAYEVATGKMEVSEFVYKIGKAGIAGTASWAAAEAAPELLALAGATGDVPAVVIIVIGIATYFVVDFAIDYTAKSLRTAHLTSKDVALLWPGGLPQARGSRVPAQRR